MNHSILFAGATGLIGSLVLPRLLQRLPADARVLAPLYNPLLRGRLHRYRAIPASTVAAALAALLDAPESGITLHRNDALIELAAGG